MYFFVWKKIIFLLKHMKVFEIIRAVVFSMPLGIFITFGLFLVVTIQMKVRKMDVILRRILVLYCLSAAIASLLLLFYYYLPDLFAYYDIVYGLSVIFAMILFYHFLCFAIRSHQSFPFFHYVILLLFYIGMFICKLAFPAFWRMEGNTMLFMATFVWSIVYSILPLYKMYNYHLRLVLVSSTTEMINKRVMIPFVAEVILFPVVFVLMPFITEQHPGIILSVLMMSFILSALRMNIPLTYAMIRHYGSSIREKPLFAPFVMEMAVDPVLSNKMKMPEVKSGQSVHDEVDIKRIYHKYSNKNRFGGQLIEIDKKEFENYFCKYKPYLNADLKINDLVTPLQSNRTYISKFVNHTYKMNFNSYVNRCRLREMERLLRLPGNKGKSPGTFIHQTGFGSYRNYLRAKKQFDSKNDKK